MSWDTWWDNLIKLGSLLVIRSVQDTVYRKGEDLHLIIDGQRWHRRTGKA